jgi:hypothetical protein
MATLVLDEENEKFLGFRCEEIQTLCSQQRVLGRFRAKGPNS